MRNYVLGVPVVLLMIGLALISCGKVSGSGNGSASVPNTTVQLTTSNFVQTTRTIKAGQTLLFSDTVNGGGFHQICLGHNQMCTTKATGPSALMSPGFTIQSGTTVSVTFPTAGTYQITCAVHPTMNLTVIVQ
jgi:plastocyanin